MPEEHVEEGTDLRPTISGTPNRWFRSVRMRSVVGVIGHLLLLLTAANLLFWALVAARFAPVQTSYTDGRVIWLGRHVMVFGHGYWERGDGYWQHHTYTKLEDGTLYDGPTLGLIAKLREEGAQSIWGSWCYSGNYPYIRKDLVTGKTTPWPANTSYNRTPGITIPIWLGAAFVRLGWPQSDYGDAPNIIDYQPPDTLQISRPSLQRFVSTFYSIRSPATDLPNPDSLSWHDTAGSNYSISWQDYLSLPWHEKWAVRDQTADTTGIQTDSTAMTQPRTGILRFWIRGRPFPVPVRIPAG